MAKRPVADIGSLSERVPMDQVRELLFGAQLKDMELRVQRQEGRLQQEISDARESFKKRLDSLESFMKSEISSLFNRLKEEEKERDSQIKGEQRERDAAIKAEQRERDSAIKAEQRERENAILTEQKEREKDLLSEQRLRENALREEQRERNESVAQLVRDLAATNEAFDRKLAKLNDLLDTTERDLRQLLLGEAGSLTDKIEERYAASMTALAKTASQIRSDMVYRTSLSSMFTEMVVKLSESRETSEGVLLLENSSDDPFDDYDE